MQDSEKLEIDVEEYYKCYGPMVFRRCMKLLQNEERALDAMQEVFVKLLANRDRLTGEFPSSLLFRIATNVCLNKLRQQRRTQVLNNEDVLENIACHDKIEKRFMINNLLDRIFKNEAVSTREIAVMFYIDRMTLQEVAQEVGLSVSGVRKRMRVLKNRVQNGRENYYGE